MLSHGCGPEGLAVRRVRVNPAAAASTARVRPQPTLSKRPVTTSFMRGISSLQPPSSSQGAASPVDAFQQGTLSFGFSAGGLLFPYYVGIAERLQRDGILTPDTPMAGASAGSLIVATCKSGLPMSSILDATYKLATDCRDNGTRFRLKTVLENMLREVLPSDIHERLNGSSYIAVTRIFPALHPELAVEFTSREDCIQALLTSCWIPWYFSGDATTLFRGRPHTDGGVTNFLPNVPHTHTVRVCCLPRQQLTTISNITISPDAYRPWNHSIGTMLGWALEPADPDTLTWLFELGQQDAATWSERTGVAAAAKGGSLTQPQQGGSGQPAAAVVVLPAGAPQPQQQQQVADKELLLPLSNGWPGAYSPISSMDQEEATPSSSSSSSPATASLRSLLASIQQKK